MEGERELEARKSGLPTLAASTIWMISLGYLGVQIAFTLETSQMSRIFQTLGADPTKLGWFFICHHLLVWWCNQESDPYQIVLGFLKSGEDCHIY